MRLPWSMVVDSDGQRSMASLAALAEQGRFAAATRGPATRASPARAAVTRPGTARAAARAAEQPADAERTRTDADRFGGDRAVAGAGARNGHSFTGVDAVDARLDGLGHARG